MDRAPPPQAEIACSHCGATHPATFTHCPLTGAALGAGKALLGRVFAQRYRVLGLLGEGGMGAVYVAEHTLIGRKVALKRLHPELAKDPSAVARFQREARAAAATGHENIVEVIDMGYGEDGAPFIVMEYLRGQTLAAAIRREGMIPPARACRILGQLLGALAAVHRLGIVHRDLKPDNVFLTKRGGAGDYVKVLDFGISKVHREEQTLQLTRTGVMLGTPYYMSPEQARGAKELDHRVDLYAAGAILYETLTGKVPFDAPNYHALLQAIVACDPTPVRQTAPAVSVELEALVHRSIGPEQDDRFQTAREMLIALVPHGAVDHGVDEAETTSVVIDADAALQGEAGELRETAPLGPELDKTRTPDGVEVDSVPTAAHAATAYAAAAPIAAAPVASPAPLPVPAAPAPIARPSSPRPAAPRAPLASSGAPSAAARSGSVGAAPRAASSGSPRAFAAQSIDWIEDARAGRRVRPRTLDPLRTTGRELAPATAQSFSTTPTTPTPRDPPGAAPLPPREITATHAMPSSSPAGSGREPSGSGREPSGSGREPSGSMPLPGSARARKATGQSTDPAPTGSQVKGSLVLAAMQHLEETRGVSALERALALLPQATRARLTGMILPIAWIPLPDYDALLDAVERAHGTGNGALAFGTGAATAERDLRSTHKAVLDSMTPQSALERLPQLWRAYHSDGEIVVESTGTSAWRIDVRDLANDTFLHAMAMAGFIKRVLELAGARDIRVTLLSCRGRGDDRTTITLRTR